MGTQKFVIALPKSHPQAEAGRISLATLKDEPFVLFERQQSSLFYSRIIAMCETAGFVPQVSQQATQIHTVVGLVGAGMGVSIVPEVAMNLQLPTVSFAQIEDNPAGVDVCLAWRKDNSLPALTSFADIVAEVARDYLSQA